MPSDPAEALHGNVPLPVRRQPRHPPTWERDDDLWRDDAPPRDLRSRGHDQPGGLLPARARDHPPRAVALHEQGGRSTRSPHAHLDRLGDLRAGGRPRLCPQPCAGRADDGERRRTTPRSSRTRRAAAPDRGRHPARTGRVRPGRDGGRGTRSPRARGGEAARDLAGADPAQRPPGAAARSPARSSRTGSRDFCAALAEETQTPVDMAGVAGAERAGDGCRGPQRGAGTGPLARADQPLRGRRAAAGQPQVARVSPP